MELPGWLAFTLAGAVLGFLVINVLMISGALYTWFERRTLGRFQVRLGPNRWGPFGILQPIADGIKLLTKEDTIPDSADRPELGSGYHTEYSGVKFAVFQLAEFLAPIVTAVIVATLFLGGTRGFDPVPGQVWFALKVFVVIFLMLWVRATWPRLRIDQIMGFAWKGLLALSLVNLFLVAAEVEILRGDSGELTTGSLWIMAAINWAVTLAAIVGYSLTLRGRRSMFPEPVRSPLANMYAEAD